MEDIGEATDGGARHGILYMHDYARLIPAIAQTCLGHRTQIAARTLSRHYRRAFRGLALTGSQFGILVTLAARPDLSIAALGREVGMDATTVVRAVQQLERRGLVRAEGGAGRQAKRSAVTPRGRRLLARAVPRWKAAHDALVSGLGGERRARVALGTLSRLEAAACALLESRHAARTAAARAARRAGAGAPSSRPGRSRSSTSP